MKAYKLFRGLLKASALTTVMFIMQACYGTPNKDFRPIYISGYVTDKANGQPLRGIRLDAFESGSSYDHLVSYTDENGYFDFKLFQLYNSDSLSTLSIEVRDDDEQYKPFDTLVSSDSDLGDLRIRLESNQ